MSTAHSEPLAAGARAGRIAVDRRRCIVTPDRVDIRPTRLSTLLPGAGLILALLLFAVLWPGALPLPVVILLVLVAVVLLFLSGMGFIYWAVAVRLVVDRARQSVFWRQGLLGMGHREQVSFWKIRHLEVEETAARHKRVLPRDVARFEVALVKTSGRRLRVGVVTVPRSLAADGLERARLVAEAVAGIAGKRVEMTRAPRRRPRVVRPHYLPSRR